VRTEPVKFSWLGISGLVCREDVEKCGAESPGLVAAATGRKSGMSVRLNGGKPLAISSRDTAKQTMLSGSAAGHRFARRRTPDTMNMAVPSSGRVAGSGMMSKAKFVPNNPGRFAVRAGKTKPLPEALKRSVMKVI
jgi:hypothetical protein